MIFGDCKDPYQSLMSRSPLVYQEAHTHLVIDCGSNKSVVSQVSGACSLQLAAQCRCSFALLLNAANLQTAMLRICPHAQYAAGVCAYRCDIYNAGR